MALIAWLVAAASTILVAVATYAVALGRGTPIITPVWFSVLAVTSGAAIAAAGAWLWRRGHHRVARWIMALAWSLAGYAAVGGLAAVTAPGRPAGVDWLVAVEGAWYMLPVLLSGACCLIAAEELIAQPGGFRLGWLLPAGCALLTVVLGLGAVSPAAVYPDVGAPLAGTPLAGPVSIAVFNLAVAVWMLSTAVAPLIVARAAQQSTGLRRSRLTILAIAAATPLLTLATYVVLGIGLAAGLVSEQIATPTLSVVFCLPPLVVSVGVAAASTARDDGVTGRIGVTARWVLRVLWLTVAAQLTALLAALVAVGSGTPSAIAASTIAVVLTVGFVAAYVPVAARLEAFMAHEPEPETTVERAGADRFTGVLSPRERDVLALIAEGKSNAAIAAELFLSERTIDSHVSSIFDKLGLGREAGTNRRVQAAAAWIRADLEQQEKVS